MIKIIISDNDNEWKANGKFKKILSSEKGAESVVRKAAKEMTGSLFYVAYFLLFLGVYGILVEERRNT